MRGELVALDLESTGLDIVEDDIIEIGAVRFRNGELLEEYSTLVNPKRKLSPQTTQITGIIDADVQSAPEIKEVLPQIVAFVGNAPVVAHNTTLDMGLLQGKHGILKSNQRLDTYDLASVLMPQAPRYNLNSLTNQLEINLEQAHRALADAQATALLYWQLWEKLLTLPRSLVREINQYAEKLNWDTGAVFSAALQESALVEQPIGSTQINSARLNTSSGIRPAHTSGVAMTIGEIEQILGIDGDYDRNFLGFEVRSSQIQIASAIADAFKNRSHLMVEAGTGTGKSLAYLTPSILWATGNNTPVVISTNTINLQDQIMNKDIPQIRDALGLDFTATVMKGRANYLCPRRVETIRRREPTNVEELRTLGKILVWQIENTSGDKAEISLRGPAENAIWRRLSAQDEDCSLHYCETIGQGACPFYQARKRAESADLVIVNHVLLVVDSQRDNQVLPDYNYIIIDEAHRFEEAVTNGLSVTIDRESVVRRLDDIGSVTKGLLGEVLEITREYGTDKQKVRMERFIQVIVDATQAMRFHIDQLFEKIKILVYEIRKPRGDEVTLFLRIEESHRNNPIFAEIRSIWRTLDEFFETLGIALSRLGKGMQKLKAENSAVLTDSVTSVNTASNYMMMVRDNLGESLLNSESDLINWITIHQGSGNPIIHSAPLHIGRMVEQTLWSSKASVVMTSATLKVNESFAFVQSRLFADDVKTLEVLSPFDYQKSVLVFVPTDVPEPNERAGFQRATERAIIELAAALDGQLMALFTSYAQLRETSNAIAPRLQLGNIDLFDQSDGSSREFLLDGFKSAKKSVLLGTRSFWEGVNIPGDDLSGLVIARLPFTVPSDPIFSARSDTYNSGFNEYALPDAILRFRQGFGRLIRSSNDRGVVVIMDTRVRTKKYGNLFLQALPDCTIHEGKLETLPSVARQWLGREGN